MFQDCILLNISRLLTCLSSRTREDGTERSRVRFRVRLNLLERKKFGCNDWVALPVISLGEDIPVRSSTDCFGGYMASEFPMCNILLFC